MPERLDIRTGAGLEEYVAIGCQLRVWVDGVEIEEVVAYDIPAGLVWRYLLDDDGYRVMNDAGDGAAIGVLEGLVRVERGPPLGQ